MKKIIIVLLLSTAGLSALFLFWYSNRSAGKPDPVRNPFSMEVILKSTDYSGFPFWNVVRQGVETAAEDFQVAVNVTGPFSEAQIDLQIQLVRDTLARKPDAVVLAAADYQQLIPAARELAEAGIPLITIDSFIDSDTPLTKIGTDNTSAGRKAGEALADLIPPGGKVAILSYMPSVTSQIDRELGVRESLAGSHEIVGTWYTEGSMHIAESLTREIIAAYPDLAGIAALNEQTTVGAARAVENLTRSGEIVLVGFDNSPPIIQYLELGTIGAIVVQNPFTMGYLGIRIAVEAVEGKRPAKIIDTGSRTITRDTMYTSENQKLLFPVGRD